jgi:hypothetical protein
MGLAGALARGCSKGGWSSPVVGEKEEGARGVLTVGTKGRCGDGVRPTMGVKGGYGLGFVSEVIRMWSGETKVWNGDGL